MKPIWQPDLDLDQQRELLSRYEGYQLIGAMRATIEQLYWHLSMVQGWHERATNYLRRELAVERRRSIEGDDDTVSVKVISRTVREFVPAAEAACEEPTE